MEIKDAELVPVTNFRRDMTTVIADLDAEKIAKAVVIKNGKPLFVVLAVPKYEELAA